MLKELALVAETDVIGSAWPFTLPIAALEGGKNILKSWLLVDASVIAELNASKPLDTLPNELRPLPELA